MSQQLIHAHMQQGQEKKCILMFETAHIYLISNYLYFSDKYDLRGGFFPSDPINRGSGAVLEPIHYSDCCLHPNDL